MLSNDTPKTCACGCGQPVSSLRTWRPGHNTNKRGDGTHRDSGRLSGFQRSKLRMEQGLPRYSDTEMKRRRARDQRRGEIGRAQRSALIDGIKLERGCVDCGYKVHPAALQFDHLPGNEKMYRLAELRGQGRTPISRILTEIAKCEVVCANCHAVRTAIRRHLANPTADPD